MRYILAASSLWVAFFILTPNMNASCVGYIDRHVICAGGCSVDTTSCFFGCVSGTCINQGGSGLCCKTVYYSAAIYPDGHPVDCGGCGLLRTHSAGSVSLAPSSHFHTKVAFWSGGPSGLIELREGSSFRIERQALVPNRCAHRYIAALTNR